MKASVKIPQYDLILDLKNAHYAVYNKIESKPSECGEYMVGHPIGMPITVITDNMPEELQNAIDTMLSNFCNH
jgi:hypothetical protein